MRFFIGILIIIGSFEGAEKTKNVEIFHLKFFFPPPPTPQTRFQPYRCRPENCFLYFPIKWSNQNCFCFCFCSTSKVIYLVFYCVHTQIHTNVFLHKQKSFWHFPKTTRQELGFHYGPPPPSLLFWAPSHKHTYLFLFLDKYILYIRCHI